MVSILCGDHFPDGVKAITLREGTKGQDCLAAIAGAMLSGTLYALRNEGLAGGFDPTRTDWQILGAQQCIVHA